MSQKDNPQKVTNKGLLIGVSYKVFLCVTDNVFHSHDTKLSLLRNVQPDIETHTLSKKQSILFYSWMRSNYCSTSTWINYLTSDILVAIIIINIQSVKLFHAQWLNPNTKRLLIPILMLRSHTLRVSHPLKRSTSYGQKIKFDSTNHTKYSLKNLAYKSKMCLF